MYEEPAIADGKREEQNEAPQEEDEPEDPGETKQMTP